MPVVGAGDLERSRKELFMIVPLIGSLTLIKMLITLIFGCFMGIVIAEVYRFFKERI